MRAIAIAVIVIALCVAVLAGESVDSQVAAQLEKEVAVIQQAIAKQEVNDRKMQAEGKTYPKHITPPIEVLRKRMAEKQAALAKIKPPTPVQPTAPVVDPTPAGETLEAKVKRLEAELEAARNEIKQLREKLDRKKDY